MIQFINNLKHRIAGKLNLTVNACSLQTRKAGLILFGLVTGTLCLLLVIGTMDTTHDPFQVDHITLPKKISSPATDSMHALMPDTIIHHTNK